MVFLKHINVCKSRKTVSHLFMLNSVDFCILTERTLSLHCCTDTWTLYFELLAVNGVMKKIDIPP